MTIYRDASYHRSHGDGEPIDRRRNQGFASPVIVEVTSRRALAIWLRCFDSWCGDFTRAPELDVELVRAMPAGADRWSWVICLRFVNDQLGHLFATDIDAAQILTDALHDVAHHDPYVYHRRARVYARKQRLGDALAQVELAAQHQYGGLATMQRDADL